MILVAIPKYTKGKLPLVAQEQGRSAPHVEGRGTRRPAQRHARPAAAAGHVDKTSVATGAGNGAVRRSRNGRRSWITSAVCRSRARANCPTIPVDERAAEVRAIKVG